MTHLHFKVFHGYKPYQFVRINTNHDLQRALYAMIEQVPVTLGGKVIHGKTILGIEPDHHHYTGWYDSYEPKTADDFKQIERDCPPATEFDDALRDTRSHVSNLIANGNTHLIGNSDPRGTAVKQIEGRGN